MPMMHKSSMSQLFPWTLSNIQTHYPWSVPSACNMLMMFFKEDLVPTCRELGIAFLAYSPLGRGMLTGAFKMEDLSPTDFRRVGSPRFTKEALEQVCFSSAY